MDWMESYLNNSSPPNKKKCFFSKIKKMHAPGISIAEIFLRRDICFLYSKQSKSNPNQSEKYPEKTKVS